MEAWIVKLISTFLIIGYGIAGPVQVRVEQDNQKSFHVGPQDRTTFELIEEYRPLSTAFNQNHPRAHSSSLTKPQPGGIRPQEANILVDFGESDTRHQGRGSAYSGQKISSPQESTNGTAGSPKQSQWLDWTRWTGCANGERIRVRQCLEVNGVKCKGDSVEHQKCFSFQRSDIPFAKDPLTIEKEIIGAEPSQPIRA
ncbi:hypothetical protein Ddc_11395 [Ditylenchus destructor]|nr:hypothetical protein Ddc_11395 [Ditylenchus destructor]